VNKKQENISFFPSPNLFKINSFRLNLSEVKGLPQIFTMTTIMNEFLFNSKLPFAKWQGNLKNRARNNQKYVKFSMIFH